MTHEQVFADAPIDLLLLQRLSSFQSVLSGSVSTVRRLRGAVDPLFSSHRTGFNRFCSVELSLAVPTRV
jgi:hypothetical protein